MTGGNIQMAVKQAAEQRMTVTRIDEIRTWVMGQKEALLADLEYLVSIRSVSEPDSPVKPYGKGCRDIIEAMTGLGEQYGFTSVNCDNRFACLRLGPDDGRQSVGIWGHLDVVAEGDGWTFPPYEMTRQGSFVIGRGIQDNKGPVAGALYAMRYLKEHEAALELKKQYILFAGCSEENGMLDLEYYRTRYPAADFNLVADCAFPVGHGEKGILHLSFDKELTEDSRILSFTAGSSMNSIPGTAEICIRKEDGVWELLSKTVIQGIHVSQIRRDGEELILVQAKGKPGHVGFPDSCVHALYVLTRYLEQEVPAGYWRQEEKSVLGFLNRMNQDFHGEGAGIACEDPVSGNVCGAITMVRLEQGTLRMQADYRYPIMEKSGDRIADLLRHTSEQYGCIMTLEQDDTPYYLSPHDPAVQKMMKVYRKVTGRDSEPYTMSGGTYARKLPRAVSYGMSLENKQIWQDPGRPGAAGDCHQPDESLHVEQLLDAVVIYITTLIELDQEELYHE